MSQPAYSHLVLSGGGFSGLVYIGAYRFLKQYKCLSSIKYLYGVSIGAMFSFFFGLDIDYESLEALFMGPGNIFEQDELVRYSPKDFLHFTHKKGAFHPTKIYKVLSYILQKLYHIQDITFSEYLKKTGKDLHIFSTCLNTHSLQDFCNETHPNMSILVAIEASSCIPFIFQPVEYEGKLYVDGACFSNCPLHTIPSSPVTKVLAINLGIHIDISTKELMSNLSTYIWSVFYSIFSSQQKVCIELYQDSYDILDMKEIPTPMVMVEYEKEYIRIAYPKEVVETAILYGYQELSRFFEKKGYLE